MNQNRCQIHVLQIVITILDKMSGCDDHRHLNFSKCYHGKSCLWEYCNCFSHEAICSQQRAHSSIFHPVFLLATPSKLEKFLSPPSSKLIDFELFLLLFFISKALSEFYLLSFSLYRGSSYL